MRVLCPVRTRAEITSHILDAPTAALLGGASDSALRALLRDQPRAPTELVSVEPMICRNGGVSVTIRGSTETSSVGAGRCVRAG